MTNQILIERWLDWYRAGDVSPGTITQRRHNINKLARDFDLTMVSESALITWLQQWDHLAPETRRAMLASFRMFYKWAIRSGYVSVDPTLNLRAIKVPPGIPRPISEVALQQALAASDEETRLMVLLGAYEGLRRAEIAQVNSDHITDLGLIVRGKGRKTRRVPIHPVVAKELVRVEGFAFPGRFPGTHVTPDYVADRLEKVLPAPWTAHSLRHRAATAWYRGCKDLRVVQQLLGHSSIQTTVRYVDVDHDALAAAVNSVA